MKINKLIYPLEARVMLDGAAAIDVIDNVDDILQIKKTQTIDSVKFIEQTKETSLPFVNVERDQRDQKNKNIVFIDAAVQDYQTLVDAFDTETEVYIIQSNQDGFLVMQNYLAQENNIDAIHIIGHGSAGQIAFGTALLNESTLEEYKSSLSTIGASLTADGDILFYGCNIADGKTGETLINQIATITNADIAASDDITGQGGDWDLEKHTGIIEARNIEVIDYQHSLITGVASNDSSVVVNNASNVNFNNSGSGGYQDPSSDRFVLVQERADVTSGTGTLNFDVSGTHSSYTPSSDNPIHVYMLFSNDNTDGNSRRSGDRTGVVTFDNAIIGVFTTPANTIAKTGISQANGTFATSGSSNFGKRDFEFNGGASGPGTEGSKDWFVISNSGKTIEVGSKNGAKGDFIRIITAAPVSNTAPVARNDRGIINEDATLNVSNNANANVSADNNINTTGEHSGDVINTNLAGRQDTDADGDTLTVTEIRTGSSEGSGTAGSLGSFLSGTYGRLRIYSNGAYDYIADLNAADALDPGDTATDSFNYTISDGNGGTDKAVIEIVIIGVNDDITAINDTDAVNEDATITRSTSSAQELDHDDTDADGDDASGSFTITAIRTGAESGSGTAGTVGSALTGTYGVLTVNSNGSYEYVASTSGADGLAAGATAVDYFTYTVRDHSGGDTDTAQLAITVTGIAPQAVADTGAVNENATLTVNSGSGAISNDDDNASYDSESLAVTNISSNGTSNSGNAAAAVTGTYGVLTMAADGSYEYVANTAAAEALDASDTVTDVFTYTLKDDADVNSSTATLTITVTGVNDDIIAVDDTDSVNEDATITRTVDDAQELDADDTDVDTDDVQGSFTITAIRTGTESGTGTGGTIGQALTGTYGTLTVNADGSYAYVADQNAADNLTTGATATDVFTYTVSDGTDTDTAQITITITGINDNDPVAVNDTDTVNRDASISRAIGSSFDIDADDTDADGDSLTITGIRVGQTEGGGTAGTIGSALVGEFGTLTLNSDGSYTYAADQDSINNLKRGESTIEYFNYTISDGTNEDVGVIAITINGISDPPVPVNDTLTIDASAQTTINSSSGVLVNDTDPDGDTISVDSIRTGQESETGTIGTIGSVLTGEYGDLTINSDGSYTYHANNAKSLNPGETATDYFTYTATDTETSVPAQISITINGINDPPEVISPINVPTLLTGQNLVIKYQQAFNDPDSGSYDIAQYKVIDPESEQEISLPTGLYIEGNKLKGKIKEPGTYSITLRAIDGEGLYVDHTFTIKVIPSVEKTNVEVNEKSNKLKTIKVKPKKDMQLNLESFENKAPVIEEKIIEKLTFNGGIRVLDVVAQETQMTNELNVEVMVNDDNKQDVESYSGLLSDGTPLPEWVKVNPETGATSASMPEGVDNVEVQVIALDKDGTVRDINIILDKPEIKNDDQILRNETNPFEGENIYVDEQNKVTFVDDTMNRVAKNVIELNKVQDEVSFTANLKLGNISFFEGQYSINFIDDNKSNVGNYRLELGSGKEIPSWLSLDKKTGEITATPPSGEKVIGIKLIAEDEDGTERTIEVDIDFEEVLQLQDDLSYVPLNDQINEIVSSTDNYGERLINHIG